MRLRLAVSTRIFTMLLSLAGAAASATAAPVAYNMSFTSVFSLPITGSFNFDSTTQSFSAFVVSFNGDTIDLTLAANTPTIANACATPATDTADYFSYLLGTAPTACGSQSWIAFNLAGTLPPQYRFRLGNFDARATTDHAGSGSGGLIDSGTFTTAVAQAPVPEPSSFALMAAGVALLSWQRRTRAKSRQA